MNELVILKEALDLIEDILKDPMTMNNYIYKARFNRLKEIYNNLKPKLQWIPSNLYGDRNG